KEKTTTRPGRGTDHLAILSRRRATPATTHRSHRRRSGDDSMTTLAKSEIRWLASRMSNIEASGIRKVFELARTLPRPVNLSIGQPHFDVPEPIKAAACAAIQRGANGYTVTQGI